MQADPELTTGGLTAAEAAARSAVLSVASYHVSLDLTGLRDGDWFGSRTLIEFDYFQPGGPGHPESIQIQDAAPDAELGDLGHGRNPAVPHPLEGPGHLRRRSPVAGGEPKPEPLERGRHHRPLGGGA